MSETARLGLPLIAAAQAQKHVTHNEALVRLDALAHLRLIEERQAPLAVAGEGDSFLVASGAWGAFAGHEGKAAHYSGGAWVFYPGFEGLRAFLASEGRLLVFSGGGWRDYAALLGPQMVLARSSGGATAGLSVLEATLSGMSGAYVEAPDLIPDRAVVFAVSCRTLTTVTGAASYDCGLSSERSKFGGSLGISAGAQNAGVIGPTAFYAPTSVRLSANGGNFTGGAVRVAVQCLVAGVPAA
ncbi:DUF2793 domain-containing protein [Pannonibacter indicus]|uniref:DUF2793 domain-containing protein n=1 Tax=Pannonibacter indicus TaxID=466044 RepID=UPI0035B35FD4